MPVMSDKVVYSNLTIKPPIKLTIEIPKSTILGAKGKLGTSVGTTTVDNVRWGTEVHVCKEGEPDCTTTHHALTLVVSSDRGNNRWILTVYVESYYVTPAAQFVYELFKFGKEADTRVEAEFRGTVLRVVANGAEVLLTDVLKSFEQIRTLKANNYFYDATGAEVPGVADQFLAYNLRTEAPFDISGLVSAILPLAITLGVLGAVIGVFKFIIPAFKK